MEGSLSPSVVALLCRTSDREGFRADGAQARRRGDRRAARHRGAADRLAGRAARHAPTRRTCATRAAACSRPAASSSDAFADGALPDASAPGACSICVTTLPALARDRPDAFVLWLDAHADFNSPDTTPSQLPRRHVPGRRVRRVGHGLRRPDARPDARRACRGVRDIDPGEREPLEAHHVSLIDRPSRLPDALAGRESSCTSTSTCSTRGDARLGSRRPAARATRASRPARRRRRRLRGHRRRGHRLPERRGRAERRRARA